MDFYCVGFSFVLIFSILVGVAAAGALGGIAGVVILKFGLWCAAMIDEYWVPRRKPQDNAAPNSPKNQR